MGGMTPAVLCRQQDMSFSVSSPPQDGQQIFWLDEVTSSSKFLPQAAQWYSKMGMVIHDLHESIAVEVGIHSTASMSVPKFGWSSMTASNRK